MSPKRVSSWQEIPLRAFADLEKAIDKVVRAFIPADYEGDRPIQYRIANRLIEEPFSFEPVPLTALFDERGNHLTFHPDKQQAMEDWAERTMMLNIELATGMLDRHLRLKHMRQDRERVKRLPYAERIRQMCALCKKGVALEPRSIDNSFLEKHPDYPARDHINDQKCESFEARRHQYNLDRGIEKETEPRWCPTCQARMREHNSRKGVEDKDICQNPLCPTRQKGR